MRKLNCGCHTRSMLGKASCRQHIYLNIYSIYILNMKILNFQTEAWSSQTEPLILPSFPWDELWGKIRVRSRSVRLFQVVTRLVACSPGCCFSVQSSPHSYRSRHTTDAKKIHRQQVKQACLFTESALSHTAFIIQAVLHFVQAEFRFL